MPKIHHVNLNSCLGGMTLGFERVNPDINTVLFYETNKPCRYVLEQYWDAPVTCSVDEALKGVRRHVKEDRLDLVTARYRKPKDWLVTAKVLEIARPRAVVIEGLASLRSNGLVELLKGLWALGYDAEGHVIPACTFGAKYKGERFWLIAHTDPDGLEAGGDPAPEQGGVAKQFLTHASVDEYRARLEGGRPAPERPLFSEPRLLRRDDALSRRVDSTRVRFLSDDVSPLVAGYVGFCVSRALESDFELLPVRDLSLVECIHNAAKKHSFLVNTNLIASSGVNFVKKNDGVHLVVRTKSDKIIDYWPSTDVYIVRGTTIRGFGARDVISMCATL